MRISLAALPTNGLVIRDSIPLEPLNQRMAEGQNNEIVFTAANVDLLVSATKGGILISGSASGRCMQPCSLCAKDKEHPVEAKIDFYLKPRGDKCQKDANSENAIESDSADQTEIIYYEDDSIDIEELIQEALILQLSPYWHPTCDEKGRCSDCGLNIRDKFSDSKDLHSTHTFGELFKKIGIN